MSNVYSNRTLLYETYYRVLVLVLPKAKRTEGQVFFYIPLYYNTASLDRHTPAHIVAAISNRREQS